MIKVSNLFVYPIKSLGGYECSSSVVTDRGLEFDRRWMLVDIDNRFISQREFPPLSLLSTKMGNDVITVQHKTKPEININIPIHQYTETTSSVRIWDDTVIVNTVNQEVDAWFSDILSRKCRLVYMTDASQRMVETKYAHNSEITSLSDGYPFLIISKGSLDNLNSRLLKTQDFVSLPLPMNRFRPNIVIEGCEPYYEDKMKSFFINDINFFGVKLCGRCVVTTINQDTAEKNEQTEPLRTLATYRNFNRKICFGQNLLHNGEGIISVGDLVNDIKIVL